MKKVLSVIVAIPLSLSLVLGTVNAEETVGAKSVANLQEQLSEISQTNLAEEAKEVEVLEAISQAPVAVQKEYIQEVGESVEEYLETADVTVEGAVASKTVDLGNETSIEFSAEEDIESIVGGNLAIGGDDLVTTNGYDFSDGNYMTKKYGDRKFTATVKVTSYGATLGKLVLGNHYTVSSKGLTMRYVSKTGTSGTPKVMEIYSSSVKTTDGKAEKQGYDMNGFGEYEWFLGVGGVGKTFTSSITSTIKLQRWNSNDKAKKQAYVYQNYKFVE